ncbi:MAG: DUF1643 domain-containing protein [Paracoccaceae bacterium]
MITRHFTKGDAASWATYSDDLTHRYLLERAWGPGPRMLFVMLNPSTATEAQNDPTVERCERRARAYGCGAMRVTNVFGLRSTDPRGLRMATDPVGAQNDDAIAESARDWLRADEVTLCAWGTHGAHLGRGPAVEALLRATGRPLSVLGLTKDGHPRHPLYVGYAQRPSPWPAPTGRFG